MMALFAAASVSAQSAPLDRGKTVRVTAQDNAQISYSLYIPRSYVSSRPTCVLFTSSPARDAPALALSACEKLGWLSVGLPFESAEFAAGPKALAVVADVKRRFPIERRGLYFAGFSEGAWYAVMLLKTVAQEAGGFIDIDLGSGGTAVPPEVPVIYLVANRAGRADGSIPDMLATDMPRHARWYTMRVFNDIHNWGPPALHNEALLWLASIRTMEGFLP
ncbi:MAG TPA: hypothetical protein VMF68_15045 [Spirochaetia bacterium]|nr:hypothetical protein [Spirochaetia bacterium]